MSLDPKAKRFIREEAAIDKIMMPFKVFVNTEASSGLLMLAASVIAIIWANSPWSDFYTYLWSIPVSIHFGNSVVSEPLLLWINDGLMAMFFFVVGLEIKRELLVGELSSARVAALPLAAAAGGMVIPALFYVLFTSGTPEVIGWGIPMATDIAFAMGILILLGERVPAGLKIFLVSLAIADDIGAVMVIALFYTSSISYTSLLIGFSFLLLLLFFNRLGIRHPAVYGLFGIGGVWFAFLSSGVHPTIAGVLIAFTIPAKMKLNPEKFVAKSRDAINLFENSVDSGEVILTNRTRQGALLELSIASEHSSTPLQRLETHLHPWVTTLVLPIFALANAGVRFDAPFAEVLSHPVTLGVFFGLVLGKVTGVTLASWIAVKTGIARLPSRVNWRQVVGVGWLSGIGFTMSLFIAGLAFNDGLNLGLAKIGVFVGSVLAAVIGVRTLWISPEKEREDQEPTLHGSGVHD